MLLTFNCGVPACRDSITVEILCRRALKLDLILGIRGYTGQGRSSNRCVKLHRGITVIDEKS